MSSNSHSTRKLLVIDDERTICSAFEGFFTRRGWSVTAAASLKGADARLARERFDIVFLDIRLPDGHGLDWLDRNSDDALPPTIVMTAFGDMDTVARSMAGRAFDYLPKPIDLDRALVVAQQVVASLPQREPDTTTPASPEPHDDRPEDLADRYVESLEDGDGLYSRAMNPVEKRVIERALAACEGNQSKAAELLGVHRNTLRNKLIELNIDH